MNSLHGFKPVINTESRVLILGTMPGVISLQAQQYYAHPRNAFWSIVEAVLGIERNKEYADRCHALLQNRVALWDVLKACSRPGSLDSNINVSSEVANDFTGLITRFPEIKQVFFNGKAAERLYKKHVLRMNEVFQRDLKYAQLPSTSPAYAAMHFDEKLEIWRNAFGAMNE